MSVAVEKKTLGWPLCEALIGCFIQNLQGYYQGGRLTFRKGIYCATLQEADEMFNGWASHQCCP